MRVTAFLLFAALGAGSASGSPTASKPLPTNILIITLDTLRADHLGCYGYKQGHTPNIDSLAADGVRFERAFTPVPITLPAHTVIFTGTYPTFSGMHDFSANRLGAAQPTLASLLKAKGFATGAVVASAVLDSRFGLNQGFDFYFDHFDFNRLQETNLDDMERPGNLVADQALAWLAKHSSTPFFFWMHLYDPHYPYNPPSPYAEEFKSHPYDGEISFADEQVGRILRFLKEKRLDQNTLIVLCGDHGEGLGEHGEQTHGFFIYNSTLHVPLILRLPGSKGGKLVSQLASLADILPTVLHQLNLPIPAEVQGKDLSPLLSEQQPPEPGALYSETFLPRLHFNWSELRGLETERYHYVSAPKPELYDVSRDPRELQNLYAQKTAVAAELSSKLQSLVAQLTPGAEKAEKTGLDPALMERLKSLGYAGFSGGGDAKTKSSDLPDPKDRIQVYELISEGMAASQHGNYPDSVAKLTTALATEPDSVAVHYLLGLDYYRLQEFPKAIAHFQRVLQVSPDYALAVYQLGLAYARAGDMPNAISQLKHALQLDPTNFSAAYNLGAAYLREGSPSDAEAALRQSIAISPDYVAAHLALGEVLIYQGKIDEAITDLRRAESLAPHQPRIHSSLAKALEAKGLKDEAQEELRKAREGDSPQP